MAKKTGSKKLKKIKIELSFLSIFLWSLFALFLLGWVFFLGTLAGRGVLPGTISEIGSPIKKIRGTITRKEDSGYQKPEEDPAFNFYDNLESKKNEVKKKSLPPKKNEPSQAVTLSRGETGSPADTSKSKETVEREPIRPLSENSLQNYFSVQIASISIPESAQKLVKELVDKDYDAYYYSATVNGKKTYRIMCGKFNRRSDAVVYIKNLKRDTGYKGFIVKFDK